MPKVYVEGYYHRSVSPGASEQPPNGTDAYGILNFVRYELTPEKRTSFYFDIGVGLQYADQRTVDLSGRLSSTPTLGIGVAFRGTDATYYLGARFFHLSNAGFQGNNQGQNQVLITFGVKF
ncbi:MAG: acyloxyacyl hydrolase [Fimbriimonadaceae bacterium]